MHPCPITSIQPYALMLSPVYVYLMLNGKFVSVKGPLDFFTPDELERMKPYKALFFPEFIQMVAPYREAARAVRALLKWQPKLDEVKGGELPAGLQARDLACPMPPAPYELSDAILRIVGPLWGHSAREGALIEPFFAAVFANEVCDLLPGELLLQARERDVQAFERAVFLSGWVVFLALHLGYCDLAFLNGLRHRAFEEAATGVAREDLSTDIDELMAVARDSLDAKVTTVLRSDLFAARDDRVSQKLAGRFKRVNTDLVRKDEWLPTIFGQKGFVDV